jgi:hypothetical protein
MEPVRTKPRQDMARAGDRIIRPGEGWASGHNGKPIGQYAVKEAAFESAVDTASNSIKGGLGLLIEMPQRGTGETAVGGPNR